MKNNRSSAFNRLLVALLVLCAFAGGVVLDKVLLKGTGQRFPEMSSASHGEHLVTYRTLYIKCGDVTVVTETVEENDLEPYLAAVSPKWNVSSQDDSGREFFRSVDDFCPEHSRFRFITLTGGQVAVYRGKGPANPGFLVREYSHLTESSLRRAEKDELRTGLVLEDEPDAVDGKVAKYLEGLVE